MSYASIKYHSLSEPLNPSPDNGNSPVNELYPGRPMTAADADIAFNRYRIPHEQPEEARDAFKNRKSEINKYAKSLERQARDANDGPKMMEHAVDDPSQTIEDPTMKFASRMEPPVFNNSFPFKQEDMMPQDTNREHYAPQQMQNGAYQEPVKSAPNSGNIPVHQPPVELAQNVAKGYENKESRRIYVAMGALVLVAILIIFAVLYRKKE